MTRHNVDILFLFFLGLRVDIQMMVRTFLETRVLLNLLGGRSSLRCFFNNHVNFITKDNDTRDTFRA